MAAALATALPIEFSAATTVAQAVVSPDRPRRLVCRWVLDPETGRRVCAWEADPDSRRPIFHLRLLQT